MLTALQHERFKQGTLTVSKDSSSRGKNRSIQYITLFCISLAPSAIALAAAAFYIFPYSESHNIIIPKMPIIGAFIAMIVASCATFVVAARRIRAFGGLADYTRSRTADIIGRDSADVLEATDEATDHHPHGDRSRTDDERTVARTIETLSRTLEKNEAERERRESMIANLIALSSDLTSEIEFDKLFPMVVAKVTETMKAERTSLYVIDWERQELWTKVAEQVLQIRVPLGHGISGRVAETGELLTVADAWDLPYFDHSYDERNRFRTKSVICCPLKNRQGRRIGVLQVINSKGKESFDENDETLFKCLASQIGNALENCLLVEELLVLFERSISTLSAMVDARHPFTAGHSARVTEYSIMIGREMGLAEQDIEEIRFASLLHDIGKIAIRDEVLLKNGQFTADEREEMNSHPVKTKTILDTFHFPPKFRNVPEIALYHHERIDGSGYPCGLSGEQLPLGSRIITVADVFDALTSRRDYPKYSNGTVFNCEPMPLNRVIDILKKDAGSHFDPSIVEAFLSCLPKVLKIQRGKHFPPTYVDETLNVLSEA
ncbi:MAG: HD domain-containing protein [Deltaproteobacteria bacterium]|nr:HD domain-containing protein [Deltaproteobacteria bacterium]